MRWHAAPQQSVDRDGDPALGTITGHFCFLAEGQVSATVRAGLFVRRAKLRSVGVGRAAAAVTVREGISELVAKEDRTGRDRTPAPPKPIAGDPASGGNVGTALRSVYDATMNEDIPGEMLDLLGKLA